MSILKLDDYHKVDLIDDSIHGSTFTTLKKSNGKIYVAKELKLHIDDNDQIKKSIRLVLTCIQFLNYPALVTFIGFSQTNFDNDNSFVLITKYMKNGSLSNLFKSLHEKRDIPQNWNNTKLIINILGISLGMKYLYDNGHTHNDLIPTNILLSSKFYPKLTDYGIANYLVNTDPKHKNVLNNPYYTAPEFYNGDIEYSFESDIFSFAMILYEFYSGCPPFVNGTSKQQIAKNIAAGERPDENKLPEGPIKELIKKCWSEDPKMRPSFNEIIEDYIINREEFWPEDVDDREVETYLNMFGINLND